MEKRIEIEIDPDGKIYAKTEGIKGEACLEELEKLLSEIAIMSEFHKTDEYYQKVNTSQTTKQINKLG